MTDYSWHIPDPETQPEFYADVPLKRLLAWLIDFVIIAAATVLMVLLTAFVGLFFLPLLFLLTGFFYRWFTIAQGAATWGMRVMAIEFRTLSGTRLDGGLALAHTAIFTAIFAIFPLQVLSMALIALTPRAQGIPDQILGTVVLNKRADGR
jgi:uncharacterized RDD family membrane protein YckC